MIDRRKTLSHFFADESGATAIEYGLILGLMVIAIVASMDSVGKSTGAGMQKTADMFPA